MVMYHRCLFLWTACGLPVGVFVCVFLAVRQGRPRMGLVGYI